MTEKLYLSDPYVLEFEAEIVERRETKDGPAVVFRETYFYPESGGQPFDTGTVQGIPVVKVEELADETETVLHFLDRMPSEDRVSCRIDGARRRDHMQQHSGQHILSAAFVEEAGAQTTSFHLGAAVSTIDLDRDPLGSDAIARAMRRANDVVQRGLAITSRLVDGAEAKGLALRKPPPDAATIRLVEVEGFDNQACCGTHPRSSAEVGPIVVRGYERFKGGTRVEFLCGRRALDDYHVSISRLRELASVLSSSENDLVATAERLQDERKTIGKALDRLKAEHLLCGIDAWMEDAVSLRGWRVLRKSAEGLSPSELRSAASALTRTAGRVVLLGSLHDGRAHLIFGRSDDVEDVDAAKLLTASLELVDGRGGGNARLAQGGGTRVEGLDEALAQAERSLSLLS